MSSESQNVRITLVVAVATVLVAALLVAMTVLIVNQSTERQRACVAVGGSWTHGDCLILKGRPGSER